VLWVTCEKHLPKLPHLPTLRDEEALRPILASDLVHRQEKEFTNIYLARQDNLPSVHITFQLQRAALLNIRPLLGFPAFAYLHGEPEENR
jgi:hypothetical protein